MGGYFDASREVWNLDAHRPLSTRELRERVAGRDALDCIQISMSVRSRPGAALIATLREQFFAIRPELELRMYGADKLDLGFLEELPMLQHVALEARGELSTLQRLAGLRELRRVYLELPRTVPADVLAHLSRTVEELAVHAHDGTPSNVELEVLAELPRLTVLSLGSYDRGLAAVLPRLRRLKKLHLRSIKRLGNLDAIAGLTRLRSLIVQLGSFAELDVLRGMPKLSYLQLWRIAKLRDVEFLSEMRGLRGLFLETLNRVARFPDARRLVQLRIVKLAAMKALRDLSALQHAPALQELVFQKADHQRPEDFLPVLRNRTLKRGGFGFDRRADVARMKALLAEHEIDGEVFMYPEIRGRMAGA